MKLIYILLFLVILKLLSKLLITKENIEDENIKIRNVRVFDNSFNCMNSIISSLDKPTNDLINSFKIIDYKSNIDEISSTNEPNYILLDSYNKSILNNII